MPQVAVAEVIGHALDDPTCPATKLRIHPRYAQQIHVRRCLMKTGLILSAGGLLLTVLGCRSDTPSPTEPQTPTAEAAAAAGQLSFYQLSAGSNRSCGVTMDNRLYCWGDGPLGDGTFARHGTPVPIGGALRFL